MNTLGALLFFVVETQLWARSSRETIVGGVPTILRDVGLGVEEGLAPFRPAAAGPSGASTPWSAPVI